MARPWVGDAGAGAKDDADMTNVPESRTGRAAGPLSREASGSPPSGHPLALEGLAFRRRRGITPGRWTHTERHQGLLAQGDQTQKAPPGGTGRGSGGRRLTRRSSCGYVTRSGCSSRHPDHRTGWRR
jgi:hypothetical protein